MFPPARAAQPNANAQPYATQADPETLGLDARNVGRGLMTSTMRIPVKPGPFTFVYPAWTPGEHGPTRPLANCRRSRYRRTVSRSRGAGMTIMAVDGQSMTDDVLKYVSMQAEHANGPTAFLVRQDGWYHTYQVNYHGGPKYPHLECIAGKPGMLAQIMGPHAAP